MGAIMKTWKVILIVTVMMILYFMLLFWSVANGADAVVIDHIHPIGDNGGTCRVEETNDEDIYGRRKLMKKIRAIAVAMAMSVFLSGCYDYGRDITIICPVINYMAVDGGAIVIYEMDGERREKKFLEKDVYACDESSRIIAVGKVYEDGSRSLRLYLYLSEEDYVQYTKDRFDLD